VGQATFHDFVHSVHTVYFSFRFVFSELYQPGVDHFFVSKVFTGPSVPICTEKCLPSGCTCT